MHKIDTTKDEKILLKEPKLYKVYLLNDDYTTMEFVVAILKEIFLKPKEEAIAIMYKIHNEGKGLCGIYPYEIAITKIDQVKLLAQNSNFPLKAVMEQE